MGILHFSQRIINLADDYLSEYYAAVFGPGTIICISYFLKELFGYFFPRFYPISLVGIIGLGLHTLSLLLILSFTGMILLRLLKPIRSYLRTPWDMLTPPFQTTYKKAKPEVNLEIVNKARVYFLYCISLGTILSFWFPIVGFVPWRYGSMQTPVYESISLSFSIPEFIYELPIISDLIFIGDYIASPDTFGYALIAITMTPMIIGFWNASYLFYHRKDIIHKLEIDNFWLIHLLNWSPRVCILMYIIFTLGYGPLWFIQ